MVRRVAEVGRSAGARAATSSPAIRWEGAMERCRPAAGRTGEKRPERRRAGTLRTGRACPLDRGRRWDKAKGNASRTKTSAAWRTYERRGGPPEA